MMTIFQQLIEAAHFQITGGSPYQWNCFGSHARFLDFNSSKFDVEFNIIFDYTNQEVFQAFLYLNGSAFRWINPKYLQAFKDESYSRNIDPRVAYDDVHYTDCEIFDDFLTKVQEAFNSGTCDPTVLISLDLTSETQEILEKLPEGTDIEKFILDSLISKIEEIKQKNRENWDILFSSLSQLGIVVTIDKNNAPISEANLQDIYNWIKSLNVSQINLKYHDKETAQGIVSYLTANNSSEKNWTFQYIYKSQ
jgi:hypothetical protein